MDVLHECGVQPESIMLIGGGARSALWRQMLADISGQTLDYFHGGDVGPALGAARLAQQARDAQVVIPTPVRTQRHQPDPDRLAHDQPRRQTFATLFQPLLPLMN